MGTEPTKAGPGVDPSPETSTPRRVMAAGHEWLIFVESPAMIAALLEDLRAARSRIWIESYIFLNDSAGVAVAEVLKDKAQAGLDVRVLYDAIGSQSTPHEFFQAMEDAGVRVHAFHSFGEAFRRFEPLKILNRRNHRKLVVIDERIAYLGGMNLTDPGELPAVARRGPSSSGWRDVHVRLTGPQLPELVESFFRSWSRAKRKRIKRRPPAYRQALLAGGVESLQFFDSGPGAKFSRARHVFCQLFRQAKKSLTISMAYFLPLGPVLRELVQARKRGVRIQVVVPGNSDVPIVQHATRYLYRFLLRRRIQIFERQHNMLHSKVVIVDDEWAALGSSNLDPRSLLINLELLAVVHSRPLAQALKEIVRHEIEHSRRITLRSVAQLSCWQRLLDRLSWSLRWWL